SRNVRLPNPPTTALTPVPGSPPDPETAEPKNLAARIRCDSSLSHASIATPLQLKTSQGQCHRQPPPARRNPSASIIPPATPRLTAAVPRLRQKANAAAAKVWRDSTQDR